MYESTASPIRSGDEAWDFEEFGNEPVTAGVPFAQYASLEDAKR